MKSEFATGRVRFVEHMGFLDVWSFLGEGVGATLYILGVFSGSVVVQWLGVAFVATAVVALLAHLGVRAHLAWRAITKFRTAWVSRGTVFMGVFLASAIGAHLAAMLQMNGLARFATGLAVVAAVLVIIYAGMMLRSMRAVTIWNTLFLPAAFSIHSVATGLTVFAALATALRLDPGLVAGAVQGAVVMLVVSALVSAAYLSNVKRSTGVLASLERLLKGMLRPRFLWGAGLVGTLVPLCLLLVIWLAGAGLGYGAALLLAIVAAGCRLYGDYAYRLSIVKSGAYEPIIPPPYRATAHA